MADIGVVEYYVLLFTGDDSLDIPSINCTAGVCKWNSNTGVLVGDWYGCGGSSVDISFGGNYEKYNSSHVSVMASKLVELTLNNYGVSIDGKRIEIHENSSVEDTIIKRGVITSITRSGNVDTIEISHVANKYNANLSHKVGDKYAHVVYGENVGDIPLSVDVAKEPDESVLLGNEFFPAFVVIDQEERYDLARITLRCAYDTDMVTHNNVFDYFKNTKHISLRGETKSAIAESFTDIDRIGSSEIGGKVYATLWLFYIPMNKKDENHEPLFLVGETVVTGYTTPSYITIPSGVDSEKFKITYKKDGRTVDFPTYIDSMKRESGAVSVLDSDDSGMVKVAGKTYWSTANELREIFGDSGGGVTMHYLDGGFSFYDEANAGVHTFDGESYNGSNIGNVETDIPHSRVHMTARSDSGETGYVSMSMTATYVVDKPDKWNNLFFTCDSHVKNIFVNGSPISSPGNLYNIAIAINAITILDKYSISTTQYPNKAGFEYGWCDQCLFPNVAEYNDENKHYRFDNESFFTGINDFGQTPRYGNDIDLLSAFSFSEVELKNPIKFFYTIGFGWSMGSTAEFNMEATIDELRIALVSNESYDLNELYASSVTNADGNYTIRDSYLDVCSKQNLYSVGLTPPVDGWGLNTPIGDISKAVNVNDITSNSPNIPIRYKSEKTGTKDVKYDLLRYGFGIGYIDSKGLENWSNILKMYDTAAIPVYVTHFDVIGTPKKKKFDTNKVFCDIGVKTSNGTVEITNTEQNAYSPEYVNGIDNEDYAKLLWSCGHLLYDKYRVKNEFPQKIADASNVTDVVSYIKNQYAIAGAVVVGEVSVVLKDRYTLYFDVPTHFKIENKLWIGKLIEFSFPNICSGERGIITSLIPDIKNGNYSVVVEMVGGVVSTSKEYIIDESGDREIIIDESGDREIIINEVI